MSAAKKRKSVPSPSPAPWTAVRREWANAEGWAVLDADGRKVCEQMRMDAKDVNDGDAALVEAAPLMLKALQLVVALDDHPEARVPGHWKEQPQPRGRPLLDPKARAQIDAAIAKAEGK